MRSLHIPTANVFVPLLAPARYKGAWGGRGSGKSHFFASLLIEDCLTQRGLRAICIREVQKSLKDSAKRLIEDKIRAFGLSESFKSYRDVIATPGDGLIVFQGLSDHNAETIKSLEGFSRAWVEEAQSLSHQSLMLLRPTIRLKGSELWFSWNPRHRSDAVDQWLRGPSPPADARVVNANWQHNPWFPPALEAERREMARSDPGSYAHIWDGDYAAFMTGAYYADSLAEARRQGRIAAHLPHDPLLPLRACWDIGLRDATAIWLVQPAGDTLHVIAYYEASGQPLAAHLDWLRRNGFGDALCLLPHDGARADVVTGTRFEDHIRQAGFRVRTIANQGAGAAMKRIEAARKLFPRLIFDERRCRGGLDALAAYHEQRDERRNIGLGPCHDWASHAADAFGLMAIASQEPKPPRLRGTV